MTLSPVTRHALERRESMDRRRTHPLLADWKWAFRGRRRAPRRDGEWAFADRYDGRLVFTTLSVLLLSAADAGLTLALLESGIVREANPFMRLLIDHDVQVFINIKTALTATGLLLMVMASHARILGRIRVRTILHGLLGLYLALIGYELALFRVMYEFRGM
jgi:hypothetical protein